MRLIDADELIERFNSIEDAEHCKLTINGVVTEIAEMPTMRVVPVEALEKIKSEITNEIINNSYPIVHGVNDHEMGMSLYGICQVIDNKIKECSE